MSTSTPARSIGRFLKCLFTHEPLTLEDHPYVKATSPDQLITAAVLGKITKDFAEGKASEWEMSFSETAKIPDGGSDRGVSGSGTLAEIKSYNLLADSSAKWQLHSSSYVRKGEEIVVTVERWRKARDHDNAAPWIYTPAPGFATINGVEIHNTEALLLLSKIKNLVAQHDETERVAADALRRLGEEEAKWNLAENLLNMVRDRNGALVPKPVPKPKPKSRKRAVSTSSYDFLEGKKK